MSETGPFEVLEGHCHTRIITYRKHCGAPHYGKL